MRALIGLKTFCCVSERTLNPELIQQIVQQHGCTLDGDDCAPEEIASFFVQPGIYWVKSDLLRINAHVPNATVAAELAHALGGVGVVRETRQGENIVCGATVTSLSA